MLERGDLQREGIERMRVPGRRGVHVRTSGSTGQPVEVVRSLEATAWIEAGERRALEWNPAYRHGDRRLSLVHVHSAERPLSPAAIRHATSSALANEGTVHADELAVVARRSRIFDELERRPPAATRGVASMLYLAARALEQDGRRLASGDCLSGGGTLPPHQQELVEAAFGCPVRQRYACWEAGVIAYECPEAGSLHVNSESVIVEIVRPGGGPAQPGEIGDVLVTPLRNHTMPLLRYRLGDLAEAPVSSRCACGRSLPVLGRLIGRANELLRGAAGRLVAPETVSRLMWNLVDSVLEFQAVQRPDLHLDVRVVQRETPAAAEERRVIARTLESELELPGSVSVERVESIPLSRAGKLQHVVSQAGAGAVPGAGA